MSSITEHMTHQHRHCDDIFSATETAVSQGNWSDASASWDRFYQTIEQHFSTEEQVLFPAFEQATGSTAGPTSVMRIEHQQMRQLFEQINTALLQHDANEVLGLTETLMILMQQHNMKEEQILYPMSQQVLPDATQTLQMMQAN